MGSLASIVFIHWTFLLQMLKSDWLFFFCYWKAYFWKNHQINFYLWSIHIWCQMFFWMFLTYVRTYPNPDTLLHMWMLGGRTHRTNSPLWKIAKMALLNPCLQCEFFKGPNDFIWSAMEIESAIYWFYSKYFTSSVHVHIWENIEDK